MKVVVLAQGSARRWAGEDGVPYLGRAKTLLEVDGETLAGRACRLFAERGCEVILVAPDDPAYDTPHARRVTLDDPWPVPNDMSKFFATASLWSDTEVTGLVWGDVWYSDHAADLIAAAGPDLHYFRRTGRSALTGCPWDESFSVTFGPGEHGRVLELARRLSDLHAAGRLRQRSGGHLPIRNHYAAHIGAPFDDRKALVGTPGQTVIDDWTDDIDSPVEYRRWVGRHQAGKTRVAVCLPWMGGDTNRQAAKRYVVAHYEAMGVPVHLGGDDTGGQWTNRARACNNAARHAFDEGAEVVLVGDADTVVPAESLWASAHAAAMTSQLIVAYTDYWKLRSTASTAVMAGREPLADPPPSAQVSKHWVKHVSSAVTVTRDLWDRTGGFDERFTAWGGEDRAFWMTAKTLGGGWWRIHGPAWHLWHQRSPQRHTDHPSREHTRALGLRYRRASGWLSPGGTGIPPIADHDTDPDMDALLALLAEPGGPLAPVEVPA